MELRFKQNEIPVWAQMYSYPRLENELIVMTDSVKKKGHLTKKELMKICRWKSPRSAGHVSKNDESYVNEITDFAFSTNNDRASIESLTLLDGVRWPTASVILHLYHDKDYPILDFRALWSVQEEVPSIYTYDFWANFTEYSREVSLQTKTTMRTLDRELWQYSKVHQPSSS